MRTVDRYRVEDALSEIGADPDRAIREDYSGRAMYGDTCFGVVLDSTYEFNAFKDAYRGWEETHGLDDDESEVYDPDEGDWLDNARSDSMGLSGIWYCPAVALR